MGGVLLARQAGPRAAPPLGRPGARTRRRASRRLRRRRLARGRVPARRLRHDRQLAVAGDRRRLVAGGAAAGRPALGGAGRAGLRPAVPGLPPRRRPGHRRRRAGRVDAGPDRRRHTLGPRLPGAVGPGHRGPLRRRTGAGRSPVRAGRDGAGLLGVPGHLGRAGRRGPDPGGAAAARLREVTALIARHRGLVRRRRAAARAAGRPADLRADPDLERLQAERVALADGDPPPPPPAHPVHRLAAQPPPGGAGSWCCGRRRRRRWCSVAPR